MHVGGSPQEGDLKSPAQGLPIISVKPTEMAEELSASDATDPYAGVITGFTHHATFVTREKSKPEIPTISFLTAIEFNAFKGFVQHYAATKEVRRDDAMTLDYLLGPVFEHALQLVEDDAVTIRQNSEKTRTVIEVYRNGTESYWIPLGETVCQCMFFTHGKKLFCKHILAGHLYLAITPKENYKLIDDAKLDDVFSECFDD